MVVTGVSSREGGHSQLSQAQVAGAPLWRCRHFPRGSAPSGTRIIQAKVVPYQDARGCPCTLQSVMWGLPGTQEKVRITQKTWGPPQVSSSPHNL